MEDTRLKKLVELKEQGITPYVERYERSHSLVEAQTSDMDTKVNIAGRIILRRAIGKLTFAHLQDQSGKIQIALQKDTLGADKYKFFNKYIDIADFVGIEGEVFTTHKGEISVLVKDYVLLSKTMRSLPEKFHGVTDQEKKYRQRYLDLVMSEDTKKRFLFRSKLIKLIRNYLEDRDFIEVETPILNSIPSGATAKPFYTHHNALDFEATLRIAPENYLKRCVVGGFERVFEFAKCFRNEGIDPSHLQEFTMLEYYASYWSYEDNMKFTEELFEYVLTELFGILKLKIYDQDIDFTTPWPRIDYRELILKDSGIDFKKYKTVDELRNAIKDKNIQIENIDKYGYGNLVDALYKKVSRPNLIQPCFVIHHPIHTKPLARKNDDDPDIADTFQLLVNTWEIINAYSELVDPQDQRNRFAEQAKAKAAGDDEAMDYDEDYVVAMEHGMPPMSGWGMGIDRLVSLLTSQENLKDCILFPLMKPEGKSKTISKFSKKISTDTKNIVIPITRDEAFMLVKEYTKTPANINHYLESEAVLRELAIELGENEELWGVTGLLHDLDWEQTSNDPSQHSLHTCNILKEKGMPEIMLNAIRAHNDEYLEGDFSPKTKLDFALRCGETITGLIYAGVLVRPDKKIEGVKVKSVKKKFKDKRFAANCRREIIMECEKLGLTLEQFIEVALRAFNKIADQIGL